MKWTYYSESPGSTPWQVYDFELLQCLESEQFRLMNWGDVEFTLLPEVLNRDESQWEPLTTPPYDQAAADYEEQVRLGRGDISFIFAVENEGVHLFEIYRFKYNDWNPVVSPPCLGSFGRIPFGPILSPYLYYKLFEEDLGAPQLLLYCDQTGQHPPGTSSWIVNPDYDDSDIEVLSSADSVTSTDSSPVRRSSPVRQRRARSRRRGRSRVRRQQVT